MIRRPCQKMYARTKPLFPRLAPLVATALFAVATPAGADVTVTEAWTRAIPGQTSTGAYMRLVSSADATLVEVASPAARIVEIHEMRMDGGVMRMSAVEKLPLPAGKAVQLSPGGYHVMLMGLREPLKEGGTLPLTLTVVDGSGKAQKIEVSAVVRGLAAAPPKPVR